MITQLFPPNLSPSVRVNTPCESVMSASSNSDSTFPNKSTSSSSVPSAISWNAASERLPAWVADDEGGEDDDDAAVELARDCQHTKKGAAQLSAAAFGTRMAVTAAAKRGARSLELCFATSTAFLPSMAGRGCETERRASKDRKGRKPVATKLRLGKGRRVSGLQCLGRSKRKKKEKWCQISSSPDFWPPSFERNFSSFHFTSSFLIFSLDCSRFCSPAGSITESQHIQTSWTGLRTRRARNVSRTVDLGQRRRGSKRRRL